MPFTLSHTVAAIPLSRRLGRRAVFPALVIGTMVPDFHYFFPGGPSRFESHTLAGLFVFCLPVGVAAYLLHHLLVAPLAYAIAPGRVREKLDPEAWCGRLPSAGAVTVVASILAGATTHLLWDAFTHAGPATAWWPWLGTRLFTVAGIPVHVYNVFQQVSTAFGLAVLAWKWHVRPIHAGASSARTRVPGRALRIGLAVLILTPAVVVGLQSGLAYAEGAPGAVRALRSFVWHGMAGAVRTGSVALLAAALFMRLRAASPAAGPPTTP